MVKAKTGDSIETTSETYQNWYSAVYVPITTETTADTTDTTDEGEG